MVEALASTVHFTNINPLSVDTNYLSKRAEDQLRRFGNDTKASSHGDLPFVELPAFSVFTHDESKKYFSVSLTPVVCISATDTFAL
ncbi:hypothetical protein AVEN_205663-1 [Araneus ventricosus]|uniref:Uncharacterized protein n=1 Tax=Araneus ventricosus TaxID=182803 RepID=A0A4Y2URE5_ARAVE|nr:hypothetical protein AVEN_205663-1 [Araneus ventricosus]